MKVRDTMTARNTYKFDDADLTTFNEVAVNESDNSNDMAGLKPMFEGWYAANSDRIGSHDKLAAVAKMFVSDLPVKFDDNRQKVGPKGQQSLTLYGAYIHKARHGLSKLHKGGSNPSPWYLTMTGAAKFADMTDDQIISLVRVEIEQRRGGE